MTRRYNFISGHFISGLPRSGSTLLSAILRQNPHFQAGISSPVASLFGNMLNSFDASSGNSFFVLRPQHRGVCLQQTFTPGLLRSVLNKSIGFELIFVLPLTPRQELAA